MVADVAPVETMKLRLLNGSHSLLAYIGLLEGWHTVAEAIANPDMEALVRRYMMAEAAPTLALPENVSAYAEELWVRFANDSLQHRLRQAAMYGSQKLPQRWLQGGRAEGIPIAVTALGIAAWMHHVSGRGPNGQPHPVDDPLAERFAQLHASHTEAAARVDALSAMRDIFPESLTGAAGFRQTVLAAYRTLQRVVLSPACTGFLVVDGVTVG